MKAFAAVCVLAVAIAGAHASGFDYETGSKHGPLHWEGECNTGQSQSPIDIPYRQKPGGDIILAGQPSLFEFSPEWYQLKDFIIVNNGHTVQISLNQNLSSTLYVKINGVKYFFGQMHCHWQSEHTMSNQTREVECHIVSYADGNKNVSDAVANEKVNSPLVVMGLFYESQQKLEDFPKVQPREGAMEGLTSAIPSVQVADSKVFVPVPTPMRLFDFLPDFPAVVYNYAGSLTTPGCNQVVNWFVFRNPMAISKDQYEAFKECKEDSTTFLEKNNRPTQPLNGRKIKQITAIVEPRIAQIVRNFLGRISRFFG